MVPTHALSILIADDDWDTRKLLSDYLAYQGFDVSTADNGKGAWSLAMRHPPHLALLDVVMPGMPGIDLIPQLKELDPEIEIILFTAHGTVAQAVEAMKRGAFCYLQKPLSLKKVLAAVNAALAARKERQHTLTGREIEVLHLMAKGYTNVRVATELGLAERTVAFHIENLLAKLHASNRTEAVVEAIRRRWIKV